ncbi:MAG: CHC2 zinc finger domain-containing protein [Luteimonas sp.]
MRALYGKGQPTATRRESQSTRLPDNWRDRLPEPAAYYSARIGKLTSHNADGWAQGVCPFHDDHDASLSVQVVNAHGGWRCFAGCGQGDIVAFHQRLRGCDFKQAVTELVRGGA